MKHRIPLLIILALLAFPRFALAQTEIRFSTVDVELRPEYDRPTLLVMQRMTLTADTILPAVASLRIPASAGKPHVVAVGASIAQVTDFGVKYDLASEGDWVTVNVSLAAGDRAIWLEYYDPGLVKNGTTRTFSYTWPADYAADNLVIRVQEPVGATNFKVSAGELPFTTQATADGTRYYAFNPGSVAAAAPLRLVVNYSRQTDTLSVESQPVTAAAPLPEFNGRSILIGGLVALGIGLIAGGIGWYWYTGRKSAAPPARKRHQSVATTPEGQPPSDGDAFYCHNCGRRASTGDRFCRSCGVPLRAE
jgi:hypothetical protein